MDNSLFGVISPPQFGFGGDSRLAVQRLFLHDAIINIPLILIPQSIDFCLIKSPSLIFLYISLSNNHVSPGRPTNNSSSIPFADILQQISQHYSRLLSRWPADRLRPAERHFQRLLQKRIQEAPAGQRDESREVNAAYSLLDNALRKRYPLSDSFMHPASKPEHYTALAQELDEAPDRTWLSGWIKRMKNLVRFQ
jgi:cytochrome b pre-mRNA-processing protein 6